MAVKIHEHYKNQAPEIKQAINLINGSDSIYLFLHRQLLRYCTVDHVIDRKKILYVTTRYLKFIPKKINQNIVIDLAKKKLIKKLNRDKYQIINLEKSEPIEHMLLG